MPSRKYLILSYLMLSYLSYLSYYLMYLTYVSYLTYLMLSYSVKVIITYMSIHLSLALNSSIIAAHPSLTSALSTEASNGRSIVRSFNVRTRLSGT